MSPERPDEAFNWRNKLDELELPGLSDRAATWEKLHARLRKKPRRLTNLWYWAAAACFLLASGTSWLMMGEKEGPAKTSRQQQRESSSMPAVPSGDPNRVPAVQSAARNHSVAAEIKVTKPSKPVYKPPTVKNAVATNAAIQTAAVQEPSPVIDEPDTVTLVNDIPVRKKLRVVHVNDLGHPVKEQTLFAGTKPSHAYPPNQPGLLPVFTPDKNTSDNIVKIRLSP